MKKQVLALEVRDVHKTYGKQDILKGINLDVSEGSVLALLGPNGAGKTTLVRILATLLKADSGTVRVYGYNVLTEAKKVRQHIGLTGQMTAVDENMTGRENIILVARLLGCSWQQAAKRADELLALFYLTDAADKLASKYSGGMRRRLDIAISLIARPKVLFLDEPTTGLDPRSRNKVWDILQNMVKEGMTIILTTQYLEEADRLARHIAVIDNGVIIANDTATNLKRKTGSGALHIQFDTIKAKSSTTGLLQKSKIRAYDMEHQIGLTIPLANPELAITIVQDILKAGITPTDFSYQQPSLDDVFLALTNAQKEVKNEAN